MEEIKKYLISAATFASTEEEKRIIVDIMHIIKENEEKKEKEVREFLEKGE